jgi:hypothetical protein
MFNLFKSDWKKGWVRHDGEILPLKYKIVNGHALLKISCSSKIREGYPDGKTSNPFSATEWWPEFNDSEFINWKENAISLEKRAKENNV